MLVSRRSVSWPHVLLPAGFLLGGVRVYGGDPSPAIVLLPLGAAALLMGVVVVAMSVGRPAPEARFRRAVARA